MAIATTVFAAVRGRHIARFASAAFVLLAGCVVVSPASVADASAKTSTAPKATHQPVEKTVWGIKFTDPFAWLQPDSPEALAWQAGQDASARQAARSSGAYDRLLRTFVAADAGPHSAAFGRQPRRLNGRWFWMGRTDDQAVSAVRLSDDPRKNGVAVIDSRKLSAHAGGRAEMLQFEPAPDAAKMVVHLDVNGALPGLWYVVDVATGKFRPIDAKNPFARPAWFPDSSGFLFNDRTADGRHRLRSVAVTASARSMPDKVFEPNEIALIERGPLTQIAPNGRQALLLTGLFGERAGMIGDLASGKWRPFLPDGFRGDCYGEWLDDETYLAIVTHDASRGRIVAIPVKTSQDPSTWRPLVAESDTILRCATAIGDRIVACGLRDVSVRYQLFDRGGKPAGEVPLPWPSSTVHAFSSLHFDRSEALVIEHESFAQRPTMSWYDAAAGTLEPLGRAEPAPLKGITVGQRFATSKDGTKVPYFIVHSSGLDLSSPKPTLIEGYGGNGIAWLPRFLNQYQPFVEAGGVFVLANLRGGGEYGEKWFEAGRALTKQNTFDDLYAIAEHLIGAGVTTSEKLALTGESNGGLLAAVALTQRPDLWRVVVPQFAVIDMLETPYFSAFPVLYGDPSSDPKIARLIMSYSPYHNVRAGTRYPSVFIVSGEKDMLPPFQGRKFAARLQAATTSGRPIKLRVWKNVGHWAADRAIWREVNAEWLSFAMKELGMKPM